MSRTLLLKARRAAIRALQRTRLNVPASKIYYRLFHRFEHGSPGIVDGFAAIFANPMVRDALAKGDYLEFGMFKGHSFWLAQQHIRRSGLEPQFVGFDSFEGLPEPTGIDVTEHGEFRKGQYACSLGKVRQNLEKAGGIDWERTHLIKGYFEESLTADLADELRVKHVGVAMIDCDLYASTVTVLDWLAPLLIPGSVLIFDDWNSFDGDDDRGQRRAVWEFLQKRPGLRLDPIAEYGLNAKAFVVRPARGSMQMAPAALVVALVPLVA